MVFLSETHISINFFINAETPGYTFVSLFSPTKARGVGAYISKTSVFSVNEFLCLNIPGYEDLRFELQFSGHKEKYIFAVIYRHPYSNSISFIDMLDEKLNTLNKKQKKIFVCGGINFNLSSPKLSSPIIDYIQIIERIAFLI